MSAENDLTPDAAPNVRWGIAEVVVGVLASLTLSAVFSLLWQLGSDEGDDLTLGLFFAGSLGVWIAFFGVTYLASKNKGYGSFRLDFGLAFVLPRDIVRGILWGVGCQLIVNFIIYRPLIWLDPDLEQRVSARAESITGIASGPGLLLLAIALILIAPLVEEIFFRGLTLRALESRMSAAPAIVISALLFAVVHLGPLQFPALFVLGCILGTLANRNGRLGENIVAHMAYNATTVLILAGPFS